MLDTDYPYFPDSTPESRPFAPRRNSDLRHRGWFWLFALFFRLHSGASNWLLKARRLFQAGFRLN
jgi:hypothetical protein